MTDDERYAAAHQGLSTLTDDGEIVVKWVAVLEVMGPDDTHYLAHRAGCGLDASDSPMIWDALGLLRAGVIQAEDQLSDLTMPPPDEDEE